MSLNNHESWKDSSWDFQYEGIPAGQGDQGDLTEKPSQPSPFDGLLNFGSALFEGIFGLIRDIFLGAGEFLGNVAGAVGQVLVGAAQAIGGFFEKLLGNIFVRNRYPELEPVELPEYLNPIQTNLEAVLQPHFDQVDESLAKSGELGEEITDLNTQLREEIEAAREAAKTGAITEIGKDMESLNSALSSQISSARSLAEKAETDAKSADEKAATADSKAEAADSKAATADGKAVAADKKAGTADEKATAANGTLDMWNSENPISPLWDLQIQINELGNLRDDEQDKAVEANQKAIEALLKTVPRTLFLPRGAGVSDDYIQALRQGEGNSAKVSISAVGINGAPKNWVGQYTFQSVYWTSRGYEPVLDGVYVGLGEGRTRFHDSANHNASILTYHVWPGEPDSFEKKIDALGDDSYIVAPTGWYTLPGFDFEVKADSLHEIYFRNGWNAATNDDLYGIQVQRIRNGIATVIGRVNPRTGLGPFWPNGNGYRTQTVSESNIPLQKGDIIRYQVYTNAGQSGQRYIQKVRTFTSWINPPEDETV